MGKIWKIQRRFLAKTICKWMGIHSKWKSIAGNNDPIFNGGCQWRLKHPTTFGWKNASLKARIKMICCLWPFLVSTLKFGGTYQFFSRPLELHISLGVLSHRCHSASRHLLAIHGSLPKIVYRHQKLRIWVCPRLKYPWNPMVYHVAE